MNRSFNELLQILLFLTLIGNKASLMVRLRKSATSELGPVLERVRMAHLSRGKFVFDTVISVGLGSVAVAGFIVAAKVPGTSLGFVVLLILMSILAGLVFLDVWMGVSARENGLQASNVVIPYSTVEQYEWAGSLLRLRLASSPIKQRRQWTVPRRAQDMVRRRLQDHVDASRNTGAN